MNFELQPRANKKPVQFTIQGLTPLMHLDGLRTFFRDALKDKALKQKIDSRIKNVYQQFGFNQEDITV
ncbi:hypothetical protein [Legionella resiliens]|uniref:Uncharacterized protein n=1 Tax=Legionella resiliens TaxID=2905958 RepID=A0ABS8WXG8_9GAMM|nr:MULTISPECIES: hypothetical protein [unclassified Legionella]MCE0721999.1 hypothetical protein [Legionella sp. 9fVS26]MCE3531153.1 hypothetical protein [Legionella sp. 8cVS16]